ncbi:MAG TPA: Gfo/Idh/MocA family oxidoreductase [Bryobacteraceae bacterium]|jgi:predicted dehydrogenase|nr:Gfo/Idh/MocA family oxidoreductase [Bryobacteraceae bacterium]
MPDKLRWGVLGVAGIAIKKVIPAMQKGERTVIAAIASRTREKAQEAAAKLGIKTAYGSYEELLADADIDAIYNPLPNHLHVPWTVKAAEAGKHVLCEKPIALSAAEAKTLIAVRDRTDVKIGEAFMVRTHPQWLRVRDLVRSGTIGELRSIVAAFSYFNIDPNNIRNMADIGGGAMMDIGCYPINISRFLFEREPVRVSGIIDRDPAMQTDRLASAMLDFETGHAAFTCSTQLVPYQRVEVLGARGRIEIEIPFNAPPDKPTRIFIDDGSDLAGRNARVEEFPVCDQYTIQGDVFSQAVQENLPVPVPIEDAVANMAVIDAVLAAGKSGTWQTVVLP